MEHSNDVKKRKYTKVHKMSLFSDPLTYIITLCLQYTTDIYCLISCHGSQLRGYVSSVHAMKHLPGLLTLVMEKGIQTMSLSMERKDLLDVSVLPAFNTSTIR